MDTHPLSGTATVRRTPEPSAGGRGAGAADRSEVQDAEAQSHAPAAILRGGKAMHILIAGGAARGIDAALSLHQLGIPCTVFEAAAGMKKLGIGVNTLPHGVRELASLGLLPELDRIAMRMRELRYLKRLVQAFRGLGITPCRCSP
jgi:hypothetical protein